MDDAQYLDRATADTLAFALRRILDADIPVFCSVRTGDERQETFETALPDDRRSELELSPLSLAAMHELIEARLGHSLPRPILVRIREAAGGNAFYALELAREHVRDEGDAELRVPRTVQELVRSRVARLPRRTREALLLAAASSAPTTAVVPTDELAPAEEAGVVRVDDGGRVHFEHPLVATAIYESAPIARGRHTGSWSSLPASRRFAHATSRWRRKSPTRQSPPTWMPPRRTPQPGAPRPPRRSSRGSPSRPHRPVTTSHVHDERLRSPTTSSTAATRRRHVSCCRRNATATPSKAT